MTKKTVRFPSSSQSCYLAVPYKRCEGSMSQALVINTRSNAARWRMQCAQLDLIGIVGTRVEATTPEGVSPLADDRYWYGWRKEMTPIEKAILCSHRECWSIVVNNCRPSLILEDDVILSPSVTILLERLTAIHDVEYVQLETVPGKKLVSKIPPAKATGLVHLRRDNGGAAAYWITPAGAAKLLTATQSIPMPADDAISLNETLQKWQAWPALAVQAVNAIGDRTSVPAFLVSGRKGKTFTRSAGFLQKLQFIQRKWRHLAKSKYLERLPPENCYWDTVPKAADLNPFLNTLMKAIREE